MISKLGPSPSAATISLMSGAILPASLRTGTTKETAGGAALAEVSFMCSTSLRPGQPEFSDGASFLWGEQLPGNSFDAPERRARQRPDPSIRGMDEGKTARREILAHQQRAEGADDRAR